MLTPRDEMRLRDDYQDRCLWIGKLAARMTLMDIRDDAGNEEQMTNWLNGINLLLEKEGLPTYRHEGELLGIVRDTILSLEQDSEV